jgi:hypothetical protein
MTPDSSGVRGQEKIVERKVVRRSTWCQPIIVAMTASISGSLLLVASGVALLGAVTSATRPGLAPGADRACVTSAGRSTSWDDDT